MINVDWKWDLSLWTECSYWERIATVNKLFLKRYIEGFVEEIGGKVS